MSNGIYCQSLVVGSRGGGYIFYRKDGGAHQPSSAMGSGAFYRSVKSPEREADHASI